MKKIVIITCAIIVCQLQAMAQGKGNVAGTVKGDSVQAFLYASDSGIAGSGYTDAKGHYETNAVDAGTYSVKFVYTNKKARTVTDVKVKAGQTTMVSLKQGPPDADETESYAELRSGKKHK
jgi:hypothetical protein